MRFINRILEKRWRKKLSFYRSKSQHYHSLYQFKKNLAASVRKPTPIWMYANSFANDIKLESEEALQQYRYYKSKAKKAKKKLSNLH